MSKDESLPLSRAAAGSRAAARGQAGGCAGSSLVIGLRRSWRLRGSSLVIGLRRSSRYLIAAARGHRGCAGSSLVIGLRRSSRYQSLAVVFDQPNSKPARVAGRTIGIVTESAVALRRHHIDFREREIVGRETNSRVNQLSRSSRTLINPLIVLAMTSTCSLRARAVGPSTSPRRRAISKNGGGAPGTPTPRPSSSRKRAGPVQVQARH